MTTIIKIELKGEIEEKYLSVKNHNNFEINTEVLRYCIAETYRLLHGDKKK